MAVKRYNGTSWDVVAGLGAQGQAATSSSIATWVKTASGGETSVSGNDDNSQPLSYTVGQELVFINGVLQKRGADYTATTGNSITGLAALTSGDIVSVWTVNAFSVSNAISNTIVDAKGDILVGTGADTPGRLAVGTNGQVLIADSTTGTGLKWGTGGKLLQMVFASNSTNNTNNTTTYSDTGLSATITPTSSSSKIYIFTSHPGTIKYGGSANVSSVFMRLMRNSTEIFLPIIAELYNNSNNDNQAEISFMYEDSPATTSSITYKTQFRAQTGCSAQVSANGAIKTMILMEVSA